MAAVQIVFDLNCLPCTFYYHLECFVTPYILVCVSEFEHSAVLNKFVFVIIDECERQYAEVDQVLTVNTCIVFDEHGSEP